MSESLSNLQLKKRLLGAAILVLVAAIVIPFLLGEPKQPEALVDEVVSTEFQSKIQPLNNVQSGAQVTTGDVSDAPQNENGLVLKKLNQIQPFDRSADAPAKNASTDKTSADAVKIEPLRLDTLNGSARKTPAAEPAATPAKVAAVAAKKTPTSKAKQPAKQAPVVKAGWAVQVGIFSKSTNAESFAATLRSDGYQPKISNAKNSSGKTNKRVWLGPFASKTEAKSISKKFEKQTGNDGYVAPYPFK